MSALGVVRLDAPAGVQQRKHADACHGEDGPRDGARIERVGVLVAHGRGGPQGQKIVGQDGGVLELAHEVLRQADEGVGYGRDERGRAMAAPHQVKEAGDQHQKGHLKPPVGGAVQAHRPAPGPFEHEHREHAVEDEQAPLELVAPGDVERTEAREQLLAPDDDL